MKKEKVCFYTFVSDDYYYSVGTHILINSFRRFHPDIDLVVFRQDMIDRVFREHPGLNFYNAKPTFAKLLCDQYDLVVNIDADTVITGRLDEVLTQDYDIGAAWNYNHYENASFENITEEMYLQAGLVASRNKGFWSAWEEANKNAMKYVRKENDTLNLVVYNSLSMLTKTELLDIKIFDKDHDYYGCKSLGREKDMYIFNDKLMLNGEEVKAYHHAKGDVRPKLVFEKMGFTPQVTEWLYKIAMEGQSEKHAKAI